MPHFIDAKRLLATFDASHDPHVPGLVFALLNIYFEGGPFEFDAGALSRRLAGSRLLGHVPPETLIEFQDELERYFVATLTGWTPRPGVLAPEPNQANAIEKASTREELSVLAFAGSLRRESYNRSLLRAATQRAPKGMHIKTFDLSSVPLFNADAEAGALPESVAKFKNAITAADALLIATPESNHGVPGVLKNALDWASRPAGSSPLWAKPVGVIGASPGQVGTARAQSQIRQTFEFTNSLCMNQPELLVFRAHERFDADGDLMDEDVARRLDAYLGAFYDWTCRQASFARRTDDRVNQDPPVRG